MRETKRYLGLELAGAKNNKTSLAALEYYPKEGKTFLLDVYDKMNLSLDSPLESKEESKHSADRTLIRVIREEESPVAKLGVNVPLELPPCVTCTRKTCPLPSNCTVPSVKWMRKETEKAIEDEIKSTKNDFTPYTQRPIELWIRYNVFPELPKDSLFEIDETLGGNRAPLTARMHFLKRHLNSVPMIEVWPKLSVAIVAQELGIPGRIVRSYRQLDIGIQARETLLLQLTSQYDIFIYERDLRKISQSLTAFDAFICAWTALLEDQGRCTKIPKSFPIDSGWTHYPICELS